MKAVLLIGMLLPLMAIAQEVKPVTANDYLALIRQSADSSKRQDTRGVNSMQRAHLQFIGYFTDNQKTIGKIRVLKDSEMLLQPMIKKYIGVTGSIVSSYERQYVNRLPATQNEYVQGRSVNGNLSWQGPGDGELFSYGPSIHTLAYDGHSYPYDINGYLVASGTGNGNAANPYNNSIFRPGTSFTQSILVSGKYREEGNVYGATIKAGQSNEQTYIRNNNNKTVYFSVGSEVVINKFTISGNYLVKQERIDHNNRNGFLNLVYQNSVLAPISFNTRQGTHIENGQRTYSAGTDNPFFLLENNAHGFLQRQNTATLLLQRKFDKGNIKLTQSFDRMRQLSDEGYGQSTSFYPAGIQIQRNSNYRNYSLTVNSSRPVSIGSRIKGDAVINYVLSDNKASIGYSHNGSMYKYQRFSNDIAISYSPNLEFGNGQAGVSLNNKIYLSTTSIKNAFLLPGVSGYFLVHTSREIKKKVMIKVLGSYTRFNNETPINRSLAQTGRIQYSVANASQFIPLTEINTYANLSPIGHRESNAGLEMYWYNKIGITANLFDRKTVNDVFPIVEPGGRIKLLNMVDHVNRGMEWQLNLYSFLFGRNKFYINHQISFIAAENEVLKVREGYDHTPIAGFSDVHKAIIKGQPVGAIVGSAWLRDASNNVLIGSDGFPLVNPVPKRIGNPYPDFTMKMSNSVSYKDMLTLAVDWEWRKGGDIWNGTQASLDYYGRSATSGNERLITNYIFDGVQSNGSHNATPVSFYDATKPINENRWVRYGVAGVAEQYIEDGSNLRLNNIALIFHPVIHKKLLSNLSFTIYTGNIVIWSAYKGADPTQLLNDQPGTAGLDFFNLPSTRTFGFKSSLQF